MHNRMKFLNKAFTNLLSSDDAVLFDELRITVVQVKICQTSSYEKWHVICEYIIIYIDMYILFIVGY